MDSIMLPEKEAASHGSSPSRTVSASGLKLVPPSMSITPALTTDRSSPDSPEDDTSSICSEPCSQAMCAECCDAENCSPDCAFDCGGFIDCDDDNFCTNVDCAEEACLDNPPPCFETDCLRGSINLDYYSPPRAEAEAHQGQPDITNQNYNGLSWDPRIPATSQNLALAYNNPQNHHFTTSFLVDAVPDSDHISLSSPKRRKTSGDFGEDSQHYPYVPAPQDSQVETAGDYLAQCKWVQGGLPCDRTLSGWQALDFHVQEQHISPQTLLHCQWNHCEENIEPSALLSHVKRKHSPERERHVCLWQGCDAMFEDADDLDRHLKAVHVAIAQPLHCEWEECGLTTVDPQDLSLHLQTDHLMDPGRLSLSDTNQSGGSAARLNPKDPSRPLHMDDLELGSTPSPHISPPAPSQNAREQASGEVIASEEQSHDDQQLEPKDKTIKPVAAEQAAAESSSSLSDAPSSSDPLEVTKGNTTGSSSEVQERRVCEWCLDQGKGSKVVKCGQIFYSAEALHKHLRDSHLPKRMRAFDLVCLWDGCERGTDRLFINGEKFKRHLLVHTQYKPFKCDHCSRRFVDNQGKKQHERTHTGDKPYRCDFPDCGKTFATLTVLTMHKRYHTGEKPLKCPYCDERFAESTNLARHRRIHEVIGGYICDFPGCGKDFHKLDHLRRHAQKHGRDYNGNTDATAGLASIPATGAAGYAPLPVAGAPRPRRRRGRPRKNPPASDSAMSRSAEPSAPSTENATTSSAPSSADPTAMPAATELTDADADAETDSLARTSSSSSTGQASSEKS